MMEFDDEDVNELGINNMSRRMENLQKLFCEDVYNDVENGTYVETEDIEEAIRYFAEREEYEKCIKLQKQLKKNVQL